jgi:CheY-like chemotaxis protein
MTKHKGTDMPKILVVDDDRALVESTCALLDSEGYQVISAFNGEEGYERAVAEKPDLLVLDVMMTHDTEGFAVARRLKENPDTQHIPVILVTGIRRAKRLPFRFEPDPDWLPVLAVMEKPLRPEQFLGAVRKATGGQKPATPGG